MNWFTKISQSNPEELIQKIDQLYPRIGSTINGLIIRDDVDNMSSIAATFYNYQILPGIREVSLEGWNTDPKVRFYDKKRQDYCRQLAEEIRVSGEITPLIIAADGSGGEYDPWIVEGQHRLSALGLLGMKSFPAVVVVDLDNINKQATI